MSDLILSDQISFSLRSRFAFLSLTLDPSLFGLHCNVSVVFLVVRLFIELSLFTLHKQCAPCNVKNDRPKLQGYVNERGYVDE